jgi:four helix bundle protein
MDEKKSVKNHKDLNVWKLSMELVSSIYRLTGTFPKEEIYGLSNQMRRAAVSVPSNIAEGAARNSKKEFLHFLHISFGSMAELETQLMIADKLGFSTEIECFLKNIEKIKKMLNGLIFHLNKK